MRKRSALASALAACVAAVCVVPTGALAAGPYRISDVEDDGLAVQDLSSKVEVSDHVVQVWETQLYGQTQVARTQAAKAQVAKAQVTKASFDERRTLREFDCEHRAVRTKDVVSYRAGQVVSTEAGPWSEWRTIAPQGRGELSLLTACCPHPEVAETYGSMNELKQLAWGRVSGPLS
jgi:hypothetical protein